MVLRINKYKFDKNNITSILSEDITQRVSTILTEALEKVYTFNGENIVKIVYRKEVRNKIYYRESKMYAYKSDGTLFNKPISTRSKQYFQSNIIDFRIKLFKQALTKISSKALEVDKLLGNSSVSDMFISLLDENDIAKAKDVMFTNGNLTPFITALNNSTNPILSADVPDWNSSDSLKLGLPEDFTPTIKEWLLSYFNESNFEIYPQKIKDDE